MDLPDALLLAKIEYRHLYRDKKSKESATNRVKPKYKLAGRFILEQCFFNVLTTDKTACKSSLTLTIEKHHWGERDRWFKSEETSFCDVTRYELLGKGELLGKIRDKGNGFPHAAKLCEAKCQQLDGIIRRMHRHPRVSREARTVIVTGMADAIDDLLLRLGLS